MRVMQKGLGGTEAISKTRDSSKPGSDPAGRKRMLDRLDKEFAFGREALDVRA